MARNVSNNNVDEIKASGVKLEKKEGAWTTCGGVNDKLLYYYYYYYYFLIMIIMIIIIITTINVIVLIIIIITIE